MKLSETILANEKGKIQEQDPDFTTESQDKGLFKLTKDIASEESPIYYYRGQVENNYVQFGTYKNQVKNKVRNGSNEVATVVAEAGDPILWRIVRINKDGSVKLIAENDIDELNYQWNSSSENLDYSTSLIKKVVDKWYANIADSNSEFNKFVVDTELCNNKSSEYDGVKLRLNQTEPQPTLNCSEGNIVTSDAGLISADEMVYAGALYAKKVTGNTTYLDNNTTFWTVSTTSTTDAVSWYTDGKDLGSFFGDVKLSCIRPVITLSADAIISSGDGTSDSPWIIE